ncbi:MAG: hypothetical protein IT385_17730 [Deltaproteobacteria bacterium]|nr:hypothetical protein [Deltaproteobacteria bacterium]
MFDQLHSRRRALADYASLVFVGVFFALLLLGLPFAAAELDRDAPALATARPAVVLLANVEQPRCLALDEAAGQPRSADPDCARGRDVRNP